MNQDLNAPIPPLSPLLSEFLSNAGIEKPAPQLAGSAGSGRIYFRIEAFTQSMIWMVSPTSDSDFSRFLRLTQFYRLLSFPVPQIFCVDDQSNQVLLEDLGSLRLYDAFGTDPKQALALYQKTIDTLVFLQNRVIEKAVESPDIASRRFAKPDLLWETDYFSRHFREKKSGLSPYGPSNRLKPIFEQLASHVEAQPVSIMHRDFQSQNIMVKGETVRIIDYQGSRIGSRYYDLASLLLDPYTSLGDDDVDQLLRYYHQAAGIADSFEQMEKDFFLAGAQRIMQALGAYCFLSGEKGLRSFEQYVKPGVKRLRWICDRTDWAELHLILC